MPSNQQRREAAKRKLERQLVRRQERARGRRQVAIIVGVVAAVLVVGGVVWIVKSPHSTSSATSTTDSASSTGSAASSTTSAAPTTPCSYTPSSVKAAKAATAPSNLSPANTGTADVTLSMNGQSVPVSLNRVNAPCAVNSFLSLASQKFYDSTDCWRLTASQGLNILQCGDPSGKGTGGPGYTFANEVKTTDKFPVGTVAMANSGADNTNGSQFFIVYKASKLPASYTIIGTVSAAGMKVVDSLVAPGVVKGAQDGPPAQKITINSVSVPANATSATGTYKTTASAPAASATE